jgi:hypothetical protein
MTEPAVVRWETLGTVAGVLALAVWALRERDAAVPEGVTAPRRSLRFRFRQAGSDHIADLEDGAILGRAGGCDLELDDPTVSKRHARIAYDGSPSIEDLGSTNGTFVNGKRIEGVAQLRRGDRIGLGAAKIVFLGLVVRATGSSKG